MRSGRLLVVWFPLSSEVSLVQRGGRGADDGAGGVLRGAAVEVHSLLCRCGECEGATRRASETN